jgi:hypothetical protein
MAGNLPGAKSRRQNCTPAWLLVLSVHGNDVSLLWDNLHAEVDIAHHHGREFVETQVPDG